MWFLKFVQDIPARKEFWTCFDNLNQPFLDHLWEGGLILSVLKTDLSSIAGHTRHGLHLVQFYLLDLRFGHVFWKVSQGVDQYVIELPENTPCPARKVSFLTLPVLWYPHAMHCTQVLLNSLIQCNKFSTNICAFTLTQKPGFNHILKL